jgi:hypothetical protein
MAIQHPELRASLFFSASVHRDTVQIRTSATNYSQDLSRQLVLKSLALKAMQKAVTAYPKNGNFDALIHSILWLSANERSAGRVVRRVENSPFTPPLPSRHWLDLYGSMDYDPTHWGVLVELVNNHGGIASLKTYGASWQLS